MMRKVIVAALVTIQISIFVSFYSPQASELPIADAHMHAYEKSVSEAQWFLKKMDDLNVKWGGGVGTYSNEMADTLGPRYIPAYGQEEFMAAFKTGGEQALQDPKHPLMRKLLEKGEKLFKAGKIKGFGEIHTDNHTSGPRPMRRHIPLLSPVVIEMYKITDRYKGFVQLHVQYSEGLLEDILTLSRDFPNSTTILAHCVPGKNPDVLKTLHKVFSQTENVYCETSGANGPTHGRMIPVYSKIFGEGNGRMYGANGLNKGWKELIERFPERIMLGTDPCCGLKPKYPDLIKEIRTYLLPAFSPEIARKLSYENAVRVFGLK